MDNLLPEFQAYKEKIPEFVIKLYHILEKKEFSDYMTWNGPSQILIKQPKKLQDKVLPHFFRHKHLSSFIRQLNMYKFNKVVKLVKERNYMYFRNQHFRQGNMYLTSYSRPQLTKIKRNVKKSKKENMEVESSEQKSDNISIDRELHKNAELHRNQELNQYKHYVRYTVEQIAATLREIQGRFPEVKEELVGSLTRCNQLLEVQEQENLSVMNLSESDLNNGRHHRSEKLMQVFEPVLFPSQNYFQ